MQEFFSNDGPFARFMNHLWDLIFISILWVVCCIPVVTAGAATTAAYYTMAKVVRHETGHIFSEFISSFRSNFKQATVYTVIYALVLLLLVFDCAYLFGNEAEGSLTLLYLLYMVILVVIAGGLYLFPFLSRFHLSNFQLLRMTVLVTFRHLISTILLLLLLAVTLLALYLMPWGILIFPGLMLYIQTFLMERILLKYSPKPEEGSEEAQKWYYQ